MSPADSSTERRPVDEATTSIERSKTEVDSETEQPAESEPQPGKAGPRPNLSEAPKGSDGAGPHTAQGGSVSDASTTAVQGRDPDQSPDSGNGYRQPGPEPASGLERLGDLN